MSVVDKWRDYVENRGDPTYFIHWTNICKMEWEQNNCWLSAVMACMAASVPVFKLNQGSIILKTISRLQERDRLLYTPREMLTDMFQEYGQNLDAMEMYDHMLESDKLVGKYFGILRDSNEPVGIYNPKFMKIYEDGVIKSTFRHRLKTAVPSVPIRHFCICIMCERTGHFVSVAELEQDYFFKDDRGTSKYKMSGICVFIDNHYHAVVRSGHNWVKLDQFTENTIVGDFTETLANARAFFFRRVFT